MIEMRWWEYWPEVLARETAALDAAGIQWERDEHAFLSGVLRLKLTVPVGSTNHEMFVVYPESYPYFRFEVYAPGLDLPYHQNPFERNLCLIGRRTHYWNVDDTAANLLNDQLPKLIATAKAIAPVEVEGLEERQGEPFGNYYRYAFSMIVVQSDWAIAPEHRSGTLKIATVRNPDILADELIRGAVLEVRGENGDIVCRADESMRGAFSGPEVEGRWGRVPEPIRHSHEGQFLDELLRIHPQLKDARSMHLKNGYLRVWAALYPEETGYRAAGEGWVFVCGINTQRPQKSNTPRPHFRGSKKKNKHKKRSR